MTIPNKQKDKWFRLPLELKLKRKSDPASHKAEVFPETASEHSEQDPISASDDKASGLLQIATRKVDFMAKRSTEKYHLALRSTTRSLFSNESSQMSWFHILSADVQLEVISYLDLTSLRRMMGTNRAFRSLLVSDSAYQVWNGIWQTKFPMLEEEYDSEHGMFLQDDICLPIAVSGNIAYCRFNRVNLPLLLSMAPKHDLPTGIDESQPVSVNDSLLLGIRSPIPSLIQVVSDCEDNCSENSNLDTNFVSTSSSTSSIRLKFTGNVGIDVYSVKANHPLPKPTRCVLKKKNKLALHKRNRQIWNPMVIPYQSYADDSRLIHVTPRLVSYFEISVTKSLEGQVMCRPRIINFDDQPELDHPRFDSCIVIGLATQDFSKQDMLPGWDLTSFGYHSDNGGLYHGSGHSRQRTEAFGPGDTVGMGVDYVAKTIFVTKNGRFLGSAYDVFSLDYLTSNDLYPVIGMDSKHTVHVNYGGVGHPFHFNLSSYCNRQQQLMVTPKSRISNKFRFSSKR